MTHLSYGQQLCKRGLFGCHAQRLGDTGSGPGVICRGCLVASSFVVAHLPRRCLQRPLLVTVVPLDWWASLANLVLDSIRGPCPLVHLGEPGRQLREKETVGELCIQQLSQLQLEEHRHLKPYKSQEEKAANHSSQDLWSCTGPHWPISVG